jgi:hypothetical protein
MSSGSRILEGRRVLSCSTERWRWRLLWTRQRWLVRCRVRARWRLRCLQRFPALIGVMMVMLFATETVEAKAANGMTATRARRM